MNTPIRIALVDDHPILLSGLRNLLGEEDGFELVGEATSGHEAIKLIRDTKPDVVVMDISMPELNGVAVSRRMTKELPSVKILILTFHEDRAYLQQAIDAGVSGYVLKRSAAENLVPAIHAVLTGGLYVDPAITNRLFESGSRQGGALRNGMLPDLMDREENVLKLVALGHTNKEVATRVGVGVKSVETYKARGVEKLGLKTRADLVRYAAVQGWLYDI